MSFAGGTVRALARTLPTLGFAGAGRLGRGLGQLAWALDRRHRRVARRNLGAALPDLPAAERRRLVRATFAQAGRTTTELLWSASLTREGLATVGRVDGLEHMDRALEGGRGALLVSAHFGNWELMGVVFGLLGMPLHVIARRLADPDLEELLHRLRTRTGNRVIHKDDAVRGALRALRQGDVVAIMLDQNTLRSQACFVPFFERPAATTRLLAQLYLRTGAPIVPAFAIPEGAGYRFAIEEPVTLEGIDGQEATERVRTVTAAATARVETRVRERPEAWLWLHDRWRTRPT